MGKTIITEFFSDIRSGIRAASPIQKRGYMRTSEMIAALTISLKENGDIPVAFWSHEYNCQSFTEIWAGDDYLYTALDEYKGPILHLADER